MMEAIDIKSTDAKYIITVDKSIVDMEIILDILEKLKLECLAKNIDFNENIVNLSEEIKKSWWKKNKDRFLEGIVNEDSD